MRIIMAFLSKTIPVILIFLLQVAFSAAFGSHCDRSLLGREGVVSSYNFPLDYKKGLECTYRHSLYEFLDERIEVTAVCLQFKRFNLSPNDYLRINNIRYTNRGEMTLANLCVPVNSIFNMYFVSEDTPDNHGYPGFFATYHVITRSANTPVNESTTEGYPSDENVFCNSPDLFQCFDGKKCINSTLQCDGTFDCEDKSDEAYATARCEGVEGQNSYFQAINISSLPLDLNNYRMRITKGKWIAESKSNDSDFGPDGPHASGYYLRTDFSNATTAKIELESENYRDPLHWGEPCCLTFWYNMYAMWEYPQASGQLNVRWSGNDEITWTRQGQFGQVWHKAEIQKGFFDWHDKIIFEASKIEDERFQIAIQDISVMPGPCHSNTDHILADDISCTFEEDECQWVTNGITTDYIYPDFGEGPPGAAQGSRYLAPNSSEPLVLVSPNVTRRGGNACLALKAYAQGTGTTELILLSISRALWSTTSRLVSGSKGWHQFTFEPLTSHLPHYVKIESLSGGVFIDDLAFFNGRCSYFGPRCENSEYMCMGSLECIPRNTAICNGVSDCPRGEDEWNCNGCNDGAFLCNYKECVPQGSRCDGIEQCWDGSDEQDCPLTGGQIAGIVIGCLAGVAAIVAVGVLVYSRSKKGTRHREPPIPNVSESQNGLQTGYPTKSAPQDSMPTQPAYAYPIGIDNQGFKPN